MVQYERDSVRILNASAEKSLARHASDTLYRILVRGEVQVDIRCTELEPV